MDETNFPITQAPLEGQESWQAYRPVIKVMGIGGGGGNAVARMMEFGVHGVEFIAANTDLQDLSQNPAPTKILLGPNTTRGLGAGGKPEVGRAAAKESARELAEALQGADMVFLAAGMGGGTGSGATPVVAEISRYLGIVTIAVVTTPFSFELGRRQANAAAGLSSLLPHTHTLITIPNDRLLHVVPKGQPLTVAFHMADDVLRQAIQGITELVTQSGLINVDFAHVRRMLLIGGGALMAIGQGSGEKKAIEAIDQALHHPLLESVCLEHANGLIINFSGGPDLTLFEVDEAMQFLQKQCNPDVEVVMGVMNCERMTNRVQVILVVTGIGATPLEEAFSLAPKAEPAERTARPLQPSARPTLESPSVRQVPAEALPVADAGDLDVPAFLRRRSSPSGSLYGRQ
ncbi:MAG: cell division protein FtsZ [Anaerolineales bacterium]|nr:cell division protein FtsZ [Anaerolineales bacterium]MDW8161600.1 cell division protein FtsZ [Anaerolineales bacterium]